jgi:hypothetical protein
MDKPDRWRNILLSYRNNTRTPRLQDGFLLAIGLLFMGIAVEVGHAQVVSICRATVPEAISRGSASFTDTFRFYVDRAGMPKKIRSVDAPFVNQTDIRACIGTWRFPRSSGKYIVVALRWEHAHGWTSMRISGKNVDLTVTLNP